VRGIGFFGWLGSWALDVLGIAAFVTALATGAPAALSVALGVISVLCVALISAAYPAILASRVQPVVAMQGKE
jgi:ABC-type antimicrobial peptide transport system permease subunit